MCPLCSSGERLYLGILGKLVWWCCRYCGAQFSTRVDREERELLNALESEDVL